MYVYLLIRSPGVSPSAILGHGSAQICADFFTDVDFRPILESISEQNLSYFFGVKVFAMFFWLLCGSGLEIYFFVFKLSISCIQVALIVGHELAHMWFGNITTMEWWTHLWLNEGFASWIEYLSVDHCCPGNESVKVKVLEFLQVL